MWRPCLSWLAACVWDLLPSGCCRVNSIHAIVRKEERGECWSGAAHNYANSTRKKQGLRWTTLPISDGRPLPALPYTKKEMGILNLVQPTHHLTSEVLYCTFAPKHIKFLPPQTLFRNTARTIINQSRGLPLLIMSSSYFRVCRTSNYHLNQVMDRLLELPLAHSVLHQRMSETARLCPRSYFLYNFVGHPSNEIVSMTKQLCEYNVQFGCELS